MASADGSFVHTPCGPRKSGMPLSVDIPAPVRTVIALALGKNSASVREVSIVPMVGGGRDGGRRADASTGRSPDRRRRRSGTRSKSRLTDGYRSPLTERHGTGRASKGDKLGSV